MNYCKTSLIFIPIVCDVERRLSVDDVGVFFTMRHVSLYAHSAINIIAQINDPDAYVCVVCTDRQ